MKAAIVPAAGRSTRMGAQKLLLPYGGTTVVGRIVDQLLESVIEQVIVVVGPHGRSVAAELARRPVCIVTNAERDADMLSSVRCGLRALPQPCDAVLVVLGDQPAVTSALVDEMVRTFDEAGKGILVPLHGGRRGHPILFSARYRDEILQRYDGVGLRGLLRAHPDDTLQMCVSTPAVLSNLNRPEDYRRETGRFRP